MSSSGAFVQVSLFIFLLAHVIAKLTTIPLLLKTSPAALAAYLCGAITLCVLYKLARRDFQAWVPTAAAGVPLVYRVVVKLYAEFVGNPHFRHPFELGGVVWMLTKLETLSALPPVSPTRNLTSERTRSTTRRCS